MTSGVAKRPLRYTHVPRPILWLIRGGVRDVLGPDGSTQRREIASFYLGKFPVTNVQLEAFRPDFERSPLTPGDDDPAAGVSGEVAAAYCAWYAEVSRKPMRLPTEAEWEHACLGGGDEAGWPGERVLEVAWCRENAPADAPLPRLDHRAANPAGLWGMLGGLWEWVADPDDLARPRVLRGGSIRTPATQVAPGARRVEDPNRPVADAGFRIAKSLR